MGSVGLEAIATDLPLVTTPNGPGDLVGDGVDGFIVSLNMRVSDVMNLRLPMLDRVRARVRRIKVRLVLRSYRDLSIQEVFERVYSTKAWGDANNGFNSGRGSNADLSDEYASLVEDYVRRNKVQRIVDLGCGDFRVSRKIVENTQVDYTGIDVVRPLVSSLQQQFGSSRVRFICRDIIDDDLPAGELYLLRQVLQHLSNAQIARILDKVRHKELIVTEHLPVGPHVKWNVDKLPGPDIRLYQGSGVFLERPPFARQLITLLEVPCPFNGANAVLRTSLLLPQSQ